MEKLEELKKHPSFNWPIPKRLSEKKHPHKLKYTKNLKVANRLGDTDCNSYIYKSKLYRYY